MKWEYEVIQTKYYENDLLDKFKSLGRQGWELISVQANGLAFFKRVDKKTNLEEYDSIKLVKRCGCGRPVEHCGVYEGCTSLYD